MREIKFRGWDDRGGKMLSPVDVSASRSYWDWFGAKDVLIMQFTGLKDKNGKEIYEGDIIRVYGDWTNSITKERVEIQTKAVEWDDEGFWYPFGGHDLGWNNLAVEVIGNIYENPELASSERSE